jgi:hypothetical protein
MLHVALTDEGDSGNGPRPIHLVARRQSSPTLLGMGASVAVFLKHS